MRARVVAALLLACSCSSAFAMGERPQWEAPPEAQNAASRAAGPVQETAQSLDGKFHTVISPLYNHWRDLISYVRLKNNQRVPVEYTITVVGSPSGIVAGTGTVTIPARASPQFSYQRLIDLAGIGPPPEGVNDTSYALYISATMEGQLFQHVVFHQKNYTMQNMSVCVWDKHSDSRGVGTSINDVHTVLEANARFPSIVGLHHYGDTPARYTARLYRSSDGMNLANFTFDMEPHEHYEALASWWQFKWKPLETDFAFNVEFSREDGGPFEAIPTHTVYDAHLESYVNLTQFCPIRRKEPEPVKALAPMPETERLPEPVPESKPGG